MSRSRGRLGRAKEKWGRSPIFVRPSLDAMRSSQNRLRSDWERVWLTSIIEGMGLLSYSLRLQRLRLTTKYLVLNISFKKIILSFFAFSIFLILVLL